MKFTRNLLAKSLVTRALFVPFLALGVFATPTQTQSLAQRPKVSCVGLHTVTWTPGVKNAPQLIEISQVSEWECVRPDDSAVQRPDDSVVHASSKTVFSTRFSCQSLNEVAQTEFPIIWREGDGESQSTFKFTALVTAVENNLNITAEGTIKDGRFRGSRARATFNIANYAATVTKQCNSSEGARSASGQSTFQIF
jgi:hypothetical protein